MESAHEVGDRGRPRRIHVPAEHGPHEEPGMRDRHTLIRTNYTQFKLGQFPTQLHLNYANKPNEPAKSFNLRRSVNTYIPSSQAQSHVLCTKRAYPLAVDAHISLPPT